MVIRSEQIEEMQEYRTDRYVEALARHLESNFPAEIAGRGLQGSKLRQAVSEGVTDAGQYNVHAASDLRLYIECIAMLSPNFDTSAEHPWAGEILRRADLGGKCKMDRINERLLFGPGGPR